MTTIDPTVYSWYRKNGEWVRCDGSELVKTGIKTTTTNLDGTSIPLPEFEDPAESTHGYYTCYVFARSVAIPDTPTGDTPVSPPWYTVPQAGNESLWMSMAVKKQDILIGTWSTPICLMGEPGGDGTPGINTATVYLYQRSATLPDMPTSEITYTFATGVAYGLTSGWVQYIPVGTNPIYVISAQATSTESTDTIPISEWADPVIMAQNGSDGADGLNGADGIDGASLYTWLKYADTPTSGMSDSPTGKTYMGIAYNKTSATESTTYSDYAWSLIVGPEGPQGDEGAQGIQGPAGADGTPRYTWIKYATSAAGAGLNDSPTGMSYIGLAYNKLTDTESTNPLDYEWALILGPQGEQGIPGSAGEDGTDGTNGADGEDAVVFSINPSVTSIVRNTAGVLIPATVTFSFFSKTGISAPVAYAGRYKIYETTNGIDWTLAETAVADVSSIEYTPSASTVFSIKCELYAAGGTVTLFTHTTVMVVADATYDASDMTAWKNAIIAAGGIDLSGANTEGAVLNGLLAADQLGAGIITALIQILAPIIDLQGSGSENSMRLSSDGLVIRNANGDIVCALSTNGLSMSGVASISNDSDTVTIDSSGVHIGAKDDNGDYIGPNSQLLASVLQFLYGTDVRVEIGVNATHISKPLLSDGTVITDDLYLPDHIVVGVDGSTTGDMHIRHSATITTIDFV